MSSLNDINTNEDESNSSSFYLDEDMITYEIFPRLPAKSLIRFKKVCKFWNSHISTPEFSQEHFNYQSQKTLHNIMNNNIVVSPILRGYSTVDGRDRDRELYFVLNLHHSHDQAKGSPSVQFIKLRNPLQTLYQYLMPVGSCDGFTCFYTGAALNSWVLWNPSLQESLEIPFPNMTSYYDFFCCGFGFDSKINDYKVVIMMYSRRKFLVYPYLVKSRNQKRDEWRITLPYSVLKMNWLPQTLANGRRVHWLANCEEENGLMSWKVLSFDMRDEVIDQIALPLAAVGEYEHVELASYPALDHEKGTSLLTLFTFDKDWSTRRDYCVWIMKEYGLVDSWTKLIISLGEPAKPLGFLSKTRFLFLLRGHSGDQLLSHDISTQRKDYLGTSLSLCVGIGNYMESLIKFDNFRP